MSEHELVNMEDWRIDSLSHSRDEIFETQSLLDAMLGILLCQRCTIGWLPTFLMPVETNLQSIQISYPIKSVQL